MDVRILLKKIDSDFALLSVQRLEGNDVALERGRDLRDDVAWVDKWGDRTSVPDSDMKCATREVRLDYFDAVYGDLKADCF